MFYNSVQMSTISIYILTIIILITYVVLKFTKRSYFFSFYNIYIWMEVGILLFITPFLFTPDGVRLITNWSKDVNISFYYMEKAVRINCIGTSVFLITLIYKELYGSKTKNISNKNGFWRDFSVSLPYISKALMSMEYLVFLSLYAVICIFVLRGLPISTDTNMLLNGIWRVPYLICMSTLPIFLFYFLVLFLNEKRGLIKVLLGIAACISMGKRSTLLLGVLYPALVYYIMFIRLKKLSETKKYTIKIIIGCVFLVIAGLAMKLVRSGLDISIGEMFWEMITGNTFADIRDGGLILYAFENKRQKWLLGKTYLADFFIFIPSAIFKYRRVYGWGAYTSNTLLGMANHPGLRGGDFMEAYLNFGCSGVIINALIRGSVIGKYENVFYNNMKDRITIAPSKVLVIWLWTQLLNLFSCSGGLNNVYCAVAILLINYIIYQVVLHLKSIECFTKRGKV